MNILFIFTDQQHRDALSCMGDLNLETTNLDRPAGATLAKEVKLERVGVRVLSR